MENTAKEYYAIIIIIKQAYKNYDIDRVPHFTWMKVNDKHQMIYFESEQINILEFNK